MTSQRGRERHECSGSTHITARRRSASKACIRLSRPCRSKHYMLWSADPTCTSWRKGAGVVNTFFTEFVIDFGLTVPEDTRGGDSTVDRVCIELWISLGIKNPALTRSYPQVLEASLNVSLASHPRSAAPDPNLLPPCAVAQSTRTTARRGHGDTKTRTAAENTKILRKMVGTARFELATYGTQNRRATRLRYAPTEGVV